MKMLNLKREKLGRCKLKSQWNMDAHLSDWQKLLTVYKAGCRNAQLLAHYFETVKNILESQVRKIWYTLLLVMFSGGKRDSENIYSSIRY